MVDPTTAPTTSPPAVIAAAFPAPNQTNFKAAKKRREVSSIEEDAYLA